MSKVSSGQGLEIGHYALFLPIAVTGRLRPFASAFFLWQLLPFFSNTARFSLRKRPGRCGSQPFLFLFIRVSIYHEASFDTHNHILSQECVLTMI